VDDEDPILARIGGRFIHLSNVEEAARSAGLLDDDDVLTAKTAFERGLVDNFVDQTLLANAAASDGVARSQPVARRLRAARESILAAAYVQERIDAAVTPENVRALYEAQSDVTRLGDEVKARHIVTATREEAVAALAELTAGADFEDLAAEISIDRATAPLGGALGYFTKDMMTPPLSRAAFAAAPGERAPIFESEFGWHVLEVIDRRATRSVAFEDVKADIERFLTLRAIEETLGALRNEARVTYYRPDLASENAAIEGRAADGATPGRQPVN
ncbi:MAG: peptidylprolyl isomerase, partial [Pseudomonadota bacterium]